MDPLPPKKILGDPQHNLIEKAEKMVRSNE